MSITNCSIVSGRAESGFSLVEVLVAMLILAIGLLGLAALQTQGVRFSNDAFIRTQGTYIAYDIIDKLRVNRDNAASYTKKNFPGRNLPPAGGFHTWAEPPYNCNPLSATIANDLSCWLNTVELVLPQGEADIQQQPAPDDNLFDISISWLDRQLKTQDACEAMTNRIWKSNWKGPEEFCLVNQTWTVWP